MARTRNGRRPTPAPFSTATIALLKRIRAAGERGLVVECGLMSDRGDTPARIQGDSVHVLAEAKMIGAALCGIRGSLLVTAL